MSVNEQQVQRKQALRSWPVLYPVLSVLAAGFWLWAGICPPMSDTDTPTFGLISLISLGGLACGPILLLVGMAMGIYDLIERKQRTKRQFANSFCSSVFGFVYLVGLFIIANRIMPDEEQTMGPLDWYRFQILCAGTMIVGGLLLLWAYRCYRSAMANVGETYWRILS